MNPMIRKELQQRMRERRGWIIPTLYLLILGAVVVMVVYMSSIEEYRVPQGAQVGLILFVAGCYTQLALLLLFSPIFSAGSLTIEKEQRTISGLLTSLLGSGKIWWGKFVASLLFVMLLLITGLPILSMAFAFGGIGLYEAAMATLTTIIILVTVAAIGLYCSSAFRRSVHATAATYGIVLALSVVSAIVCAIMVNINRHQAWVDYGFKVKGAMYFNPFFFLTMSFAPFRELYPEWTTCLMLYAGITLLAILFTLRNLQRSGETA